MEVSITAAENGRTVSVPQGANFRVSLEGNPTTGYSWSAAPVTGDVVFRLPADEYERSKPERVGSGGTFNFVFRGHKLGTATLTFAYARPWEKGTPPARTFTVTITVVPRAKSHATRT